MALVVPKLSSSSSSSPAPTNESIDTSLNTVLSSYTGPLHLHLHNQAPAIINHAAPSSAAAAAAPEPMMPESRLPKNGDCLGKCRLCNHPAYYDERTNDETGLYLCCTVRCHKLVLHRACITKETKRPENFGRNLSWQCTKCRESVHVDGSIAVMLSLGEFLYHRLLRNRWFYAAVLGFLLLGYVAKFVWFVQVVAGFSYVDRQNNAYLVNQTAKALYEQNLISRAEMSRGLYYPRFTLYDLWHYRYCELTSDSVCYYLRRCDPIVFCTKNFFIIDWGHCALALQVLIVIAALGAGLYGFAWALLRVLRYFLRERAHRVKIRRSVNARVR